MNSSSEGFNSSEDEENDPQVGGHVRRPRFGDQEAEPNREDTYVMKVMRLII